MPEHNADLPAIARALVESADKRVSGVEAGLDRHIVRDEAQHGEIMRRIQAIELAMARAEGASFSRLLPWVALAVSAGGLVVNIWRG